jgi:lysophosphatidate acyltransferase
LHIVLDPIPTVGLTAEDVGKLTQTIQDLMLKEIIALTEQARGTSAKTEKTPAGKSANGVAKVTGRDA